MAVEVSPLNILGGGTPAVTGFSDTMATAPAFARNAISPPSDDWLWTPLSGDSPLATPTATGLFSFGVALPAGGGNGLQVSTLQWAINPLYELTCGIVPVVCYTKSLYYAAQKKFVQVQYNNGSGTIAFALGWMNYIDLSGSGAAGNQNFNHDGYAIRLDTRGLLQRWNSGVSGPTGLHADLGGITPLAGKCR